MRLSREQILRALRVARRIPSGPDLLRAIFVDCRPPENACSPKHWCGKKFGKKPVMTHKCRACFDEVFGRHGGGKLSKGRKLLRQLFPRRLNKFEIQVLEDDLLRKEEAFRAWNENSKNWRKEAQRRLKRRKRAISRVKRPY